MTCRYIFEFIIVSSHFTHADFITHLIMITIIYTATLMVEIASPGKICICLYSTYAGDHADPGQALGPDGGMPTYPTYCI